MYVLSRLLPRPVKDGRKGHQNTNSVPPALYTALQELGYTPYHYLKDEPENKRRYQLWTEALECKYLHKDRPYGRQEFERLLGRYDACLDLPGSMFWDDLYQAYPNAKVILTTRDVDSWFRSMQKTIFSYLDRKSVWILRYMGPKRVRQDIAMNNLIFKAFCNNERGSGCRQAYLDHNERVRNSIPASQLLEYGLGDGWDPLCEFLGFPVPDKPYPKSNSAAELEHLEEGELAENIWFMTKKLLGYATSLVAVGLGVWLYFIL